MPNPKAFEFISIVFTDTLMEQGYKTHVLND